MGMTLLEKILSVHSNGETLHPGDIVDIQIDCRTARDFGGANVIKALTDKNLKIDDPSKTIFTFDCNPTGSDQKYAANQHACRQFARENNIRVFDINEGIGTHLMIDNGLVLPGSTAVSTDSHANILGALGAFGQGMGDLDIAAAWNKGKVWFKVPPSAKLHLEGILPPDTSPKDVALNLLNIFGPDMLLGYSVEIFGKAAEKMTLDDRITIASMATEMGAIIILFQPDQHIINYCSRKSGKSVSRMYPNQDAAYEKIFQVDVSQFRQMISRPGKPHDTVPAGDLEGIKIDSAFIGSCTNGRMSDMIAAAEILNGRKIAPGVILKIVPATDAIWQQCLHDGILEVFKKAGALVSNAGCAGCAAGQVGQNGPGEITVSTGNRNFSGKQGRGSVYLASPQIVAASALAGYITTADKIPASPRLFINKNKNKISSSVQKKAQTLTKKETVIEGRVWVIPVDNIDTDMIFHNRYLTITNASEMGQYTFDNLAGYEDFARKVRKGDIILTGRNFGCGSSRQQAVDCFLALGIQAIIAGSFGAIYERNAINAALPVLVTNTIDFSVIENGEMATVDFLSGRITLSNAGIEFFAEPFSDVQYEIYCRGGLL
ncbi:MAG TPA: aconitase/3-isopropylmalate dehydratase large subunit family protein [Bacteroidales bacterium]|nr:aconitase/3-isopropylmalate dehydratase large subunit family protein [Bacteroidales bacterium]